MHSLRVVLPVPRGGMEWVGEVEALICFIFEYGGYFRPPDNPAEGDPIVGHGVKVAREGIGTVIRGCRLMSTWIAWVIHGICSNAGVQAAVLEVAYEYVLDISRVAAVGPLQSGIFRGDMTKQ